MLWVHEYGINLTQMRSWIRSSWYIPTYCHYSEISLLVTVINSWIAPCVLSFGFRSLKSRVKVLVDGTLLIPNLIPEDAGNYTCIPTNGLLTPPSASAHLKVKRKGLACCESVWFPNTHSSSITPNALDKNIPINYFLRLTPLLSSQTLHAWAECPGKRTYLQAWRGSLSARCRLIPQCFMSTGPKMGTIWILTR